MRIDTNGNNKHRQSQGPPDNESSGTNFKAIILAILRGIKDKLKFQQRPGL